MRHEAYLYDIKQGLGDCMEQKIKLTGPEFDTMTTYTGIFMLPQSCVALFGVYSI